MDLDLMKRLALAITEQFGDNSEVVVHDLKGGDAEHTIVAIENGHVSQRQLGDGPSRIVLETLQHKDAGAPGDMRGYLTKTRDGRILKSSTVFLKDQAGEVEGVFSINYDITELLMAERAIDSILNHKTAGQEQPDGLCKREAGLLHQEDERAHDEAHEQAAERVDEQRAEREVRAEERPDVRGAEVAAGGAKTAADEDE